jgi:hypothetical protein
MHQSPQSYHDHPPIVPPPRRGGVFDAVVQFVPTGARQGEGEIQGGWHLGSEPPRRLGREGGWGVRAEKGGCGTCKCMGVGKCHRGGPVLPGVLPDHQLAHSILQDISTLCTHTNLAEFPKNRWHKKQVQSYRIQS